MQPSTQPRQGVAGVAEYLASQGRKGDDTIAHLTSGETIIPEDILEKNPKLKEDLKLAFEYEDVPMERYVVGSGVMSINPKTGLPEFGWLKKTWKSVRKTVKKAGPVIGAVVGGVIGGAPGAAIGAGIGSKTSAKDNDDILRNMAIAFGGTGILQGAGLSGAVSAAKQEGIGAFFKTANWQPMASGQAGITGFFQNVGSGLGRNLGLGNTATFQSAGLSAEQAKLVQAEMAASGLPAVDAAIKVGITDPTIISNLGSTSAAFGPGLFSSLGSSYAGLSPLQQWAVQTTGEVALGLAGEDAYDNMAPMVGSSYMSRPLRSGARIEATPFSAQGIAGIQGAQMSPPGMGNMTGGTGMQNIVSDIYSPAMDNMRQGNQLLASAAGRLAGISGLGAPQLTPINVAFPKFVGSTRNMFANGGRKIHKGGGKVDGPGTETSDDVNAYLSDNEFVMTAKAVRGAGNGSIERGADKMYKLMDEFEERVS